MEAQRGGAAWVGRCRDRRPREGAGSPVRGLRPKPPHLLVPPVRAHEAGEVAQLQSEHLPRHARHAVPRSSAASRGPPRPLAAARRLAPRPGGVAFEAVSYWPTDTSSLFRARDSLGLEVPPTTLRLFSGRTALGVASRFVSY